MQSLRQLTLMASSHGMLHQACKFCPVCLQAESPEQRAVAIESAAQAIQATQQWRQKRKFLSPQQLSTWEPLVRMSGLRMPPGKPETVLINVSCSQPAVLQPIPAWWDKSGQDIWNYQSSCLTMQISWQGQDQEGHPLLIVHIGRLCNECQSHELAQQAVDAIISQVGIFYCKT